MLVLSLDLEMSGPSLTKHGIVSIGACLMNDRRTVNATFQRNVMLEPDKEYDEETVEQFWKKNPEIYEFIQTKQIRLSSAIYEFNTFLKFVEDTYGSEFVIITDVDADITWMDLYLNEFGYPRLHFNRDGSWARGRTMVTSSYFEGICFVTGLSWDQLPESTRFEHDHNPLHDAQNLADTFFLIREKIESMKS